MNKASDQEKLVEAFGSVGLRWREITVEGRELRMFARAHGVPEGEKVCRALEIANGDVLFFDELGRYVGMGSSYDVPPLFWPRGRDEPVVGGFGEGSTVHGR
jgi:hypothetical protein